MGIAYANDTTDFAARHVWCWLTTRQDKNY